MPRSPSLAGRSPGIAVDARSRGSRSTLRIYSPIGNGPTNALWMLLSAASVRTSRMSSFGAPCERSTFLGPFVRWGP
jgi:hypothetical protein